jgi:hypothetical protein
MERRDIAQTIMRSSIALFFFVLTISVGLVAWDIHCAKRDGPAAAAKLFNTQADALRGEVSKQFAETRTELGKQISNAVDRADTRIGSMIATADKRIDSIQKDSKLQIQALASPVFSEVKLMRIDLNAHLSHFDSAVDQSKTTLISLNKSIVSYETHAPGLYNSTALLINNADNLSKRADVAMPKFLEASQTIATNVVGMTADGHAITTDVHTVTHEVAGPKTKKGKVWTIFKVFFYPGAQIYSKF